MFALEGPKPACHRDFIVAGATFSRWLAIRHFDIARATEVLPLNRDARLGFRRNANRLSSLALPFRAQGSHCARGKEAAL